MKDRIKKIRVDAKMTQEEFGAAIGATRGMVTTYEKGTVPTLSTRMLIYQKFHVSETWLETGEGDPYVEGLIPTLSHALMRMPSVCAALERILPLMTDDDLDRIDEIADLIRQKFGK
jgi:transcriptional regulator with XRE-family HTH domain